MTVREKQWLGDSFDLIDQYLSSEDIREDVNATFSYKSRPLFFYINLLIRFSPTNYFDHYQKSFYSLRGKDYRYINRRALLSTTGIQGQIFQFFNLCKTDATEHNRLLQTVRATSLPNSYYSPEEYTELERADQAQNPQKPDLIDRLLQQKEDKKQEEKTKQTVKTKTEPTATPEQISEELAKYQKQTGKEVKYTEKIHPTGEGVKILGSQPEVKPETKSQIELPDYLKKPTNTTIVSPQGTILTSPSAPQPPQQTQFSQPPKLPQLPKLEGEPAVRVKQGINAAQRGIGGFAKGLGRGLLQTGGGFLKGGGGLAAKAGGAVVSAAGRGLLALGASMGMGVAVPVIAAVVIVLIILFTGPLIMDLLKSSSPLTGQLTSIITPSNNNLSSCTFYRGGDNTLPNGKEGLGFNIPEWPALINEVASKVGVPNSILAGILRVECPNCFTTPEPSYITNDYDSHCSKDSNESCVAYGAMQFTPSTFTSTFQGNKSDMGILFNKESVRTEVDPFELTAPASMLRMYSIRDSVIAAAFKTKKDAGMDPPYNEEAVRKIARSYYGACEYTQGGKTFNYCDDLWKSYSQCQEQNIAPGTPLTSNNVVFYCQGNTSWQTTCALGQSGCGPSSLAIVLSSFGAECNGQTCTPPVVDNIMQDSNNNWRTCGGGSSMTQALQSDWFKNMGFEVGPNIINGNTLDMELANEYITNGYLIVGSSRSYPCANCKTVGALVDHIFVVDAINGGSAVDIRDPNNCSYADGNDENQQNRTKNINSFPWLYAYPVKKVR